MKRQDGYRHLRDGWHGPGRQSNRGSALILVVVIGLVLVGMAAGLVALSSNQTYNRARYETYKDEFAAAEIALNKAYAQAQFLVRWGTHNFIDEMVNQQPPSVEDFEFTQFSIEEVFNGMELIPSGERWSGYTLQRMRYRIDVTARKTDALSSEFTRPGVSLRSLIEITHIPLFLYAIFYNQNMEIAPGPFMQVNGLVHSNGNTYFQSGGGLDFLRNVTVAGNVYYGRMPGSGQGGATGDVRFTNGSNLVSMRRSDGWLSSTSPDWFGAATDRWNGGLKDSAHGVLPLDLPIPEGVDPYALIERADPANDSISLKQEKFEYKADMKIITGSDGSIAGYNANGNQIPLTYPDPADPTQEKSIISTSTFYDAREGQNVTTVDINLGNMVESGIVPANGILYVSTDSSTAGQAVRLVNGAELPVSSTASGFTVATDQPLYIQGDYNTVNQTLAMVVSDALSILSNQWNDANSANFNLRNASATEVNAVCMQGIVPSGGGIYSGGVENYFRFLERWGNVDFRFSGSLINLWDSQKATGAWRYGSPVYEAPRRIWSWDTALGGIVGPPGAPRVIEIRKTSWEQ